MVVNGDVLTDLDVTAPDRASTTRRAPRPPSRCTPVEDPSRYGVVVTDVAGQVEAFIEKPPADEAPSNAINAGTYVLEPTRARPHPRRPQGVGRAGDVPGAGRRRHACTPSTATRTGSTPARPRPTCRPTSTCCADGEQRAPRRVGGRLGPRRALRRRCRAPRIGEDATLTEAVVLPGATIEAGARVHRSIVGPGATVRRAPSCSTSPSSAPTVDIEAAARLTGERVPADS